METWQSILTQPDTLAARLAELAEFQPQLVFVFGGVSFFQMPTLFSQLRDACPNAILLGCSTAGEVTGNGVLDGSLVITATRFKHVTTQVATTRLTAMEDSHTAGQHLAAALPADGLRAVFVLGPGVAINGSGLVDGLSSLLPPDVVITGGLAGDGGAFTQTWVLGPTGIASDQIVAVGFYGKTLNFSHGSFGGWESFGPARQVTRSIDNVLYELDGRPALEVYKRYLGDYAKDLPASGLLFPFAMLGADHDAIGLIRTILGVNEADGSLTLAGNIDPNGYLQLMHASTDRLLDGAEAAAEAALAMQRNPGKGMAILVSCVGRKLVMGERVDEEIEAVAEIFGTKIPLTGFYSYGEISPFMPLGTCKLHNQTMTITWISEEED